MCNKSKDSGLQTMADPTEKTKKKSKSCPEDGNQVDEAKDNVFFKQMLDLIPAHFYFDNAAKEKLHAKRPLLLVEDVDEEEELAQRKFQWKRAKFDPKAMTSVTELQEQLVSAEEQETATKSAKKKMKNKGHKTNPAAGGAEVFMSKKSSLGGSKDTTHLDDLQARFQAKMKALQEKRKANRGNAQDMLEKKRLARRMSKLKLKQKRKQVKTERLPNGGTPHVKEPKVKPPPSKPVFNKDGNIVFSKFDFTNSGDRGKKKDVGTGKNYKQLLERVERKKEKAKALEKKDKSAAKAFMEKEQWQTVMQKAEGAKIKDDTELLKKSIVRKEKTKKRTKEKWDARVDKVDQRKQEKQDKRKANIKKKKDGRINKKIKKSKKKGHIIPGF